MVCLTLQPKSDGVTLKDTFVNIRDTGEFCFNMAALEQAHQMHQTAFELPPEVDEFAQTRAGEGAERRREGAAREGRADLV